MKVQHTFELSDDARMGISMARTGQIKLASREVCNEWLAGVVAPKLEAVELAIDEVKRDVLKQLGVDDE